MAAAQSATQQPLVDIENLLNVLLINRPSTKRYYGGMWQNVATLKRKDQSDEDVKISEAIEKIGECQTSSDDKKYMTNTSKASVVQSVKQLLKTLDNCLDEVFSDGVISWDRIAALLLLLAHIVGESQAHQIKGRMTPLGRWCEGIFERKPVHSAQQLPMSITEWIASNGGWASLLTYAARLQLPAQPAQESQQLDGTYRPFQLRTVTVGPAAPSAPAVEDAVAAMLALSASVDSVVPRSPAVQQAAEAMVALSALADSAATASPAASAATEAKAAPKKIFVLLKPKSIKTSAAVQPATATTAAFAATNPKPGPKKMVALVKSREIKKPAASTAAEAKKGSRKILLVYDCKPAKIPAGAKAGKTIGAATARSSDAVAVAAAPAIASTSAAASASEPPSKKLKSTTASSLCNCGTSIADNVLSQQTMAKCPNCVQIWCLIEVCNTSFSKAEDCIKHQEQIHHSRPPGRIQLNLVFNTGTRISCNCRGVATPVFGNNTTIAECRLCKNVWCLVPQCRQRFANVAGCVTHQYGHTDTEKTARITSSPSICSRCGTPRKALPPSKVKLGCEVCGNYLCDVDGCTHETYQRGTWSSHRHANHKQT